MKRVLFIITMLYFTNLMAHGQSVHTYITQEAFKVLIKAMYQQIPSMKPSFTSFATNTALAGSHMEDDEDIVWGYSTPGGTTVSITHFWQSDNGDFSDSYLSNLVLGPGLYAMGPYPNAYKKFINYVTSQYSTIKIPFGYMEGGRISYNGLIDFYNTGICTIDGIPTTLPINYSHDIALHYLGRMAHLLQDMTVPTHVHLKSHGSCTLGNDIYEQEHVINEIIHHQYNVNNINSFVQPFADPNNPNIDNEPLHFLMFTTNQITDYFKVRARDCYNNSYSPICNIYSDQNIGVTATTREYQYLQSVLCPPLTTSDKESMVNQSNYLMPLAIRATAGLYYWFYRITGMTSTALESLTSVGISGPSEISINPSEIRSPVYNFNAYGNGTGFLSFAWQKRHVNSSEWEELGGGETCPLYLLVGSYSDFYLKVTATDEITNQTLSSTYYISVNQVNYSLANNNEVEQKIEAMTDLSTKLETSLSNYPNPFNPTTTIQYTLADEGNVSLKVYDIIGREVAILHDSYQNSGVYKVNFNADKLSSGIYYYKLATPNKILVKKMIVAK